MAINRERGARVARRVLFIHNRFPGQFGDLGRWLAGRGWSVAFATAAAAGAHAEGVRIIPYAPHRDPHPRTHPYAQPMERAALYAQAFVRAALEARRAGYRPDVIVSHAGWGAGICARDVFPEAAAVAYAEWWYRHPGVDVAYLAEAGLHPPPSGAEAPMFERMRNAPIALEIASADATICPTQFQAAQFPDGLRGAIRVEPDGVDTDFYRPDPAERRSTLGGLVDPDARVVTYATRGMEPHRGFPQFMEALPRILAADPRAVAVVAGENVVAYGGDALRGVDWKARALGANAIDPARRHFVGTLGPEDYRRLLRRSDAHVYLSVPFVLSWSMLEAMSVGCAIVASDTAPVREVADATEVRLVDMRSPEAIADAVIATLGDPTGNRAMRASARARATGSHQRADCHARKLNLFERLVAGNADLPASTPARARGVRRQ